MGTPCALKCKNSPLILTSYFSFFILTKVSISITPNVIPKVVPWSNIHTVDALSPFFKMEPGTCSAAPMRLYFSICRE